MRPTASMKKFFPLAIVLLALAAVPVALGDNGVPASGTTPAAQSQQQAGGLRSRLELLRLRLHRVEVRFAQRCGTGASTAPAECVQFAQRLEQRLQRLDGRLQQLIQTIQSTCTASSTDPRCRNADRKVAVLHKLDAGVEKLAQKLQDWLKA